HRAHAVRGRARAGWRRPRSRPGTAGPGHRAATGGGRAMGALTRFVRNARSGRLQKTLSATAAAGALPLAFEVYLEHYKGAFGDKWEWMPLWCTPPIVVAGVAGVYSERAARTALPAASALYAL